MIHALYPGSFDPLHNGHLDIIERASALFDTLTVAVLHNPLKPTHLFTLEERLNIIHASTKHLSNVNTDSFQGLLVDYAHQKNAHLLIKSLRNTSDFEYEQQMAQLNKRIQQTIDSVFLMSNPQWSYVSSTRVRELASLGVDVQAFVPQASAVALAAKFA